MEINIEKDSLEKALNNIDKKEKVESEKDCKCHPGEKCKCAIEEEIGYHKGALNTLAMERNELVKIISNVEMIMGAHLKRLGELGVDIKQNSKGCPDC